MSRTKILLLLLSATTTIFLFTTIYLFLTNKKNQVVDKIGVSATPIPILNCSFVSKKLGFSYSYTKSKIYNADSCKGADGQDYSEITDFTWTDLPNGMTLYPRGNLSGKTWWETYIKDEAGYLSEDKYIFNLSKTTKGVDLMNVQIDNNKVNLDKDGVGPGPARGSNYYFTKDWVLRDKFYTTGGPCPQCELFDNSIEIIVDDPLSSSTPKPIVGNLHFTSKELGINFEYPTELMGLAHEEQASIGKGGSSVKGEEWWRIYFDKTGFESGYFEVTASTTNYTPTSWEGTNHWINEKITSSDTENSVKQKLTTANFQVVKVQKLTNSNNLTGYKVWTMDCYGGCMLSRVYLVPLKNSRYNNLLIYTVLKSLTAGEINATIEQARTQALQEIINAESNQEEAMVKKYISGQDLIFNSLTFNN